MKNNSNLIILLVGSVFVILGLHVTVLGINMIKNAASFKTETISVTGTITNIESERYNTGNETRLRYNVSVDYIIDGIKYESIINEYKRSMRIGDEITLYYPPDNPLAVNAESNVNPFLGGIIISSGGLIFIIAGIVFLNKVRKNIMLRKYLKQNGKIIYAEVIAAETDYTLWVSFGSSRMSGNRTYPYSFIKCAVMEPGTNEIMTTYKSGSVKNSDLSFYVGKQVKVYLHPQDKSKYYVDLEDLLGK